MDEDIPSRSMQDALEILRLLSGAVIKLELAHKDVYDILFNKLLTVGFYGNDESLEVVNKFITEMYYLEGE